MWMPMVIFLMTRWEVSEWVWMPMANWMWLEWMAGGEGGIIGCEGGIFILLHGCLSIG